MKQVSEQPLLYQEDLNVGDSWTSDSRMVSADDVAYFARLTGDHDPLHTDISGQSSPFGEPVAHGLLGLGILAGLSTNFPRVATLAFVSVTDWEFTNPIFFGQKVHVVTEIESLEQHGRRACRVVWFRRLVNEQDKVVQQGRFITLVASKSRVKKSSPKPEDTQRGNLPPR